MDKSLEGSALPERVKKYCVANHLISKGDGIVAGVSGGADSMCLLLVLCSLREEFDLSIYVAHINHCIRGKDADNDEQFVADFCEKTGIPFFGFRIDVTALAKQSGCSVEEAGREARYQTFQEVCTITGAVKTAVAHNLDDQAETVLFRMFRGTGLKGLQAMRPISGNIIRPLLSVTREEIEVYLQSRGISFRTDETNNSDYYSRNRIRRNILPQAENSINTKAKLHICELAEQCMEAADFIGSTVEKAYTGFTSIRDGTLVISIDGFRTLHPYIQKELVLYAVTSVAGQKKDITNKHVISVVKLFDRQVSRSVNLPYNLKAVRIYEGVCIRRNDEPDIHENLQENVNDEITGVSVVPGIHLLSKIGMELKLSIQNYQKSDPIPKNRCTKWFDYDKIRDTIQIRCRREGDYLNIARGRVPLKKFFINNKIPVDERKNIPLLAENSHILWVIGYRATESCNIDENTKRVLVAELRPVE